MHELRYDAPTNHWYAYEEDGYTILLFPKDFLIISIVDACFTCQINYDFDWYLLIGETKFLLDRNSTYQVHPL